MSRAYTDYKVQGASKLLSTVAFFMLCLTILGCGTPTAEIMNSWKGAHVSRLIRSWGPPQHVTTDGAGGKIYIWKKNIDITLADAKAKTKGTITYSPYLDEYTIDSKTTYTDPVVLEGEKVRMFWVDRDGIIYTWRAEGFIVEEGDTVLLVIVIIGGLGFGLLLGAIEHGDI